MGVILIKFMKVVFKSGNERECNSRKSKHLSYKHHCRSGADKRLLYPVRVALIQNPRRGIQNPRLFLDSFS